MTKKIETPDTKDTTVTDFSKLSTEEKIAAFKEATKSEDFKDVDLYAKLGLDKPIVDDTASKNQAVIEAELPKYEESRAKLAEAGYKFEKVAMSETEKMFSEKIEKQSLAKFAEQQTHILKIDKDFPIEDIVKMSIPTEDKVTIMATLEGVAVRNQDSVDVLRKELDGATAQLKDAKLASPPGPEKDTSGEDRVTSKLKAWGWDDLDKSKDAPTKTG
jgi:hypothetical protein